MHAGFPPRRFISTLEAMGGGWGVGVVCCVVLFWWEMRGGGGELERW